MKRIYVDGQAGTTGLQINQRLQAHRDVEILKIDEALRKDPAARKDIINRADVVFLCLPDDASREAVAMIENSTTCVIDASTAHRTKDDWVYGLPEREKGHRARIAASRRICVPGCHATGFALLLYPLVKSGLVPADYPVSAHSVTGYSGGGRQMIETYEAAQREGKPFDGPRHYALELGHKHLPEMQKYAGLARAPIFTPILGNYAQGMTVGVPLHPQFLPGAIGAGKIHECLSEWYRGEHFVTVMPLGGKEALDGGTLLDPRVCNDTNRAQILVFGNDERVFLAARFDNLGKGASGAAVQCMNIVLGLDEKLGLE